MSVSVRLTGGRASLRTADAWISHDGPGRFSIYTARVHWSRARSLALAVARFAGVQPPAGRPDVFMLGAPHGVWMVGNGSAWCFPIVTELGAAESLLTELRGAGLEYLR